MVSPDEALPTWYNIPKILMDHGAQPRNQTTATSAVPTSTLYCVPEFDEAAALARCSAFGDKWHPLPYVIRPLGEKLDVLGNRSGMDESFIEVILATGDIIASAGYSRALTAKTLVYLNLSGHIDKLDVEQVIDRIIYSTKLAQTPYLNDDHKFDLSRKNTDIENLEQLIAAGANASYAIELCTPDL